MIEFVDIKARIGDLLAEFAGSGGVSEAFDLIMNEIKYYFQDEMSDIMARYVSKMLENYINK